jgi:hypothetical protein
VRYDDTRPPDIRNATRSKLVDAVSSERKTQDISDITYVVGGKIRIPPSVMEE